MPKKETKKETASPSAVKITKRVVKKNTDTAKKVLKKEVILTKRKAVPDSKEKDRKGKKREKVKGAVKSAPLKEKYFARWVGRDFLRSEDETFLYYVSTVACFVAAIWSFKDGSIISAITFVMLLVVIVFELQNKSKDIDYEINLDGIMVGDRLYRFDEIRSFEITQKNEFDVIKIQLKAPIFPVRELHLHSGQDIVFIRTLLCHFLPEEKQKEVLFNFKGDKKLTEKEYIDEKVKEYLKGKF